MTNYPLRFLNSLVEERGLGEVLEEGLKLKLKKEPWKNKGSQRSLLVILCPRSLLFLR